MKRRNKAIPKSVRFTEFTPNRQRKSQSEYGSAWSGTFQASIPAVVLEDFVSNGQPETGSILLAVTDEGLEQLFSNWLGNTRTVVNETDVNVTVELAKADRDLSVISWNKLTGIQHQVHQSALDPLRIKRRHASALAGNRDIDEVKLRMGLYSMNRLFDDHINASE